MRAHSVPSISAFLLACLGTFCATAGAQDDEPQAVGLADFGGKVLVYKTEGYYEYVADGVPVLGLITGRVSKERVKFTMCDSKTIDLEFRQLSPSKAKCPSKYRAPGSWQATSTVIVPLVKAPDSGAGTTVMFDGKLRNLGDLPERYKGGLVRAEVGDTVGFAFTNEHGKKSLVLVDPASGGTSQ